MVLKKGGPLRCYVCAGAWNAEHGRRRRMGRVVIRAIKAFLDGGGRVADLDKLRNSALFGGRIDQLGYMTDTAAEENETVLLTSELLADALRLTHPDAHPPERSDLANLVTQQLLALQPFVFPAVKPVEPHRPSRDGSVKCPPPPLKEPSRYPCADCASTIPLHYCTVCNAEFEKRSREKWDRHNANQRKWYAQRKTRRARWRHPTPCAACGKDIEGKRKDALFCSTACRQRAHREAHGRAEAAE